MKRIQKLVDHICEEVEGAKDYAEAYVECKAVNSPRATQYKAMALDELNHANILHQMAVEEIETLRKVFTAPQEMQDKWDRSHILYVEQAAWVKTMLNM